jgi:hypothetical protein
METLIDAFFDRMHWFILIFHESSFRETAQQVLESGTWDGSQRGPVLALLMVGALGLQCVIYDPSWVGHKSMTEASLEARSFLTALIAEVRSHLIDLLDDCCIETIQVCSLLGTFYIFHGSPSLAWSVLGLSVRTAYALALHCDDDDQNRDQVDAQVRRRNWNHIMVADTFAAMIYGRPASLDAAFSCLHPLYDLGDTVIPPELGTYSLLDSERNPCSLSRLTFHVLKFRLYEIIRQALNRFRVLRLQNPISVQDLSSLAEAVQYIRSLLDSWKAGVPPNFDCERISVENVLADLHLQTDRSAGEQRMRRHLALQVLTLQVTYDSAIIFTHRPLLEYRVPVAVQHAVPSRDLDVLRDSLDLSVQAALRISRIPVAPFENEFCLAFILMNFFTAGVILCIPPTIWPLSAIAHESKAGTMRIIRASRKFRSVSQIATHTEQLLTRLLKLSLQQEIDNGLQMDNSNASESVSLPRRTTEQEGLTSYNEDNGQDVDAHSMAISESTNRSSAAANNSAQFQIPSAQVSETTSSFTATRSQHSAGRTEGIGILPFTPQTITAMKLTEIRLPTSYGPLSGMADNSTR